MANDFVRKLKIAIDTALDTHADIVALTGRDTDNIVSANAKKEIELPLVVYDFITAVQIAADQDTRDARIQFSADADEEGVADELLGVIERVFDQPLLASLSTPLDAQVVSSIRIGQLLDVTLRATQLAA